ncbi:nucleoside 2-deoxyribosyltransferase [Nanoarchaeota archaeon]
MVKEPIYFCGAIRGGRGDVELYSGIIKHLQKYGEVLSVHVGDKNLDVKGEEGITDENIHDRDLEWLMNSGTVVAEVTTASLGVGYEIGRRVERGKKRLLCLYRPQEGKKLSAMIAGCRNITNKEYSNLEEAKKAIDDYFNH